MISPRWKTPKHWVWCPIGTVCEIVSGGTPKTSLQENFNNGDIPWITPADLSGYKDVYIAKGKRNITAEGMNSSGARLMPAGTVLFSSRAPIGYVAIAANPLTSNQGFKSFIPSAGIAPKYLYYFLIYAKPYALKLASGTTFQEISGKSAEKIPLTFPALSEQVHIVSKIEELLSDLDTAVAGLQRIKSNLKRYRASVLQAAVEGRLTAEWRQENPPSETGAELLARLLKERRAKWEENHLKKYAEQGKTPPKDWKGKYPEPVKPDTTGLPELPEGWVWGNIDQLAHLVTSGSRGWKEFYSTDGQVFIRAQDIKTDKLRLSHVARVTIPSNVEGARSAVENGDILITITGANVTKSALVDCIKETAFVSQHVALLKPSVPEMFPYCYLWIISPNNGRKTLEAWAYGAGKPGLNLTQIRELTIPVPAISEQSKIVLEVESRLSIAYAAEKTIDSALQRAARLRQSILKRAFEGRLVPQDPNDEPASVLLERIRAEQEKQAATVKWTRAKSMLKGHAS